MVYTHLEKREPLEATCGCPLTLTPWLLQICVSVGQPCVVFRDKSQMARLCTHPYLMPDGSTPDTQALCHLTLLATPASSPLHNVPLSDQITFPYVPARVHTFMPQGYIHRGHSVMFPKLLGCKTQLKSL